MKKSFIYVGIDISKKSFDVAVYTENGTWTCKKFTNDNKGFAAFKQLLNPQVHWCVMEASGPYYLKLATFLFDNKIGISIINPLVIRRFSQMRMTRTKTDKKDAIIISQYGHAEMPAAWTPEPSYILELNQMQAYCDQLIKSRQRLSNQLGAFEVNTSPCKIVITSLKKQIHSFDKQIQMIESEMLRVIKDNHVSQFDHLKSIPGVGPKTALAFIVTTNGFSKFQNAKQVSSYVGLSPRIFESGTSVKGKSRICKMGMARIRALLYLCAMSAKKCNRACKELYDRLVEKGKPKMVALIAVANKLIKQAFAIATSNTYYDKNIANIICK